MDFVKDIIVASRPWSFTASIVPILVTTAVCQFPLVDVLFARVMAIGLFIQAGANLTNTYFDYLNGVDTKQHNHDPTLVDKKMYPVTMFIFAIACYGAGIVLCLPAIVQQGVDKSLAVIFSVGLALGFFYTASPVGLKYRALGDITIFLCFGPLLMQFTSLMLQGEMRTDLYLYSVPVGLLTEAILHTNNARDIKADTIAGATTLASLIGFQNSYYFFVLLLLGSYGGVLWIALWQHAGCLLSFLTLPLAYGLVKKFKEKNMSDLTEDTAKMHLPFGILMFVGILCTSKGLLYML